MGGTKMTLRAPGESTPDPTLADGWLEGTKDQRQPGTLNVKPHGLQNKMS